MLETLKTSDIIDHFYKPGVGAGLYALKQVKAALGGLASDPPDWVTSRVDTALQKFTGARTTKYDWDNTKKNAPLRRKGAAQADNRVDRAVSAVFDTAAAYRNFDKSSEQYKLANELLDGCLPDGVFPVTSARYEEQHSKVNELLERLRGEFSENVDKLHLSLFVDNLEKANADYGAKLTSLNNPAVTFDQVQAAEGQAVESYFQVIVVIWAAYIDDPTTRNKLLAPIEEQNERIARYYKRRGSVPDVDPNTGDVVSGDEPSAGDNTPATNDATTPATDGANDPVVEPVTPGE